MEFNHKHSPGPWITEKESLSIFNKDSALFHIPESYLNEEFGDICPINNLRLIEQTPELLNIVEMFLVDLESRGTGNILLKNHIRSVLKKAGVTIT